MNLKETLNELTEHAIEEKEINNDYKEIVEICKKRANEGLLEAEITTDTKYLSYIVRKLKREGLEVTEKTGYTYGKHLLFISWE